MTVQQLIDNLKKLDPRSEVVLTDNGRFEGVINDFHQINSIVEDLKGKDPAFKKDLEANQATGLEVPNKVVLTTQRSGGKFLDAVSRYILERINS